MNSVIMEDILNNKRGLNKYNFLNNCCSVMIYGAGSCGKDVLALFNSKSIPVICFLDQKGYSGENFKGVPVFKANDKCISAKQKAENCVVIAVFNPNSNVSEIIEYLKGLGYKNIITFVELFEIFSDFFKDRLWLTALDNYNGIEGIISKGQDIWADNFSCELYKSILKFRISGDYKYAPLPQLENQYFPTDIPEWKLPQRFVDCGAYDGDTLLELHKRIGTIESIAAFEPDNSTFLRLCKLSQSSEMKLADEVFLWPCGIWSNTEQLSFSSGMGEGSNISMEGDSVIQCVALDEALNSFRPTFIKMDIEGSEYQALLGTKRIINDYHPQLSISLYHRPGDLWQIPLLLKEWDIGYKFYLRVHRFNGFELVLYAI